MLPAAIPDDCVRFAQALHRLAQGTRRQQPAVARAAPIEDHHFQRSLQAIVLQTIVGDDHIAVRMRCKQGMPGGNPIGADEHWHAAAPRQQKRLIADYCRLRIGGNRVYRPRRTAMSATDDPRPPAGLAQVANDPEDQRGLAAATDGQVADDHHRHRQAGGCQQAGAVEPPPQPDQRAEQPGKRQQRPESGHQAALIPAVGQPPPHARGGHQCGDWVANDMRG
ncbi:MAG: hypothetical protein FAZ92_02784 [Accumulibacter sp.]|nr:MAG: hypothetical protein FAZ92_02784 [Accumulibacter sp.]